ncbi:MAG TPA: ABC transporter permease [Sumerlaeia bacterium]|nr:ABC transporter permease [Sumerlaeia bacterium]
MFLRMLLAQARHRWSIVLLVFLAISSVVALYVYLRNTSLFANRSMQLIMKNMGHNMLILPEEANPLDVYLCTDRQVLFSDRTTHRLARVPRLASKYYVSVLQKRVRLGEREYLLTGIEPVARADETREKGNMMPPLDPGQARLGASAAGLLGNREVGDPKESLKIPILGAEFEVVETLPPKGTQDDFRVYIPLADCQRLLGQEGRINAILAFECLEYGGSLAEIEAYQRRELEKAQPGFKHISRSAIAEGRYLARRTTQRSLYYLLGIALVVAVLIIVVTGLQEVAERRGEVAILLAMGTDYVHIVGLFAGKMLILAAAAALTGFIAGSNLAVWLTSPFLAVNTAVVQVLWGHLPSVVAVTCLIALLAEAIPMIQLLRMDPNAALTEG